MVSSIPFHFALSPSIHPSTLKSTPKAFSDPTKPLSLNFPQLFQSKLTQAKPLSLSQFLSTLIPNSPPPQTGPNSIFPNLLFSLLQTRFNAISSPPAPNAPKKRLFWSLVWINHINENMLEFENVCNNIPFLPPRKTKTLWVYKKGSRSALLPIIIAFSFLQFALYRFCKSIYTTQQQHSHPIQQTRRSHSPSSKHSTTFFSSNTAPPFPQRSITTLSPLYI